MGHPATPSRACEPCRTKRRKCDLKSPRCSQCSRANIKCPGYADPFSLRIKDQTTTVARRLQAPKGRFGAQLLAANADRAPCAHSGDETSTTNTTQRSSLPNQQPLSNLTLTISANQHQRIANICENLHTKVTQPHPEVLAVNYYMNTYAPVGSFNYLPGLYQTLEQSDLLNHALLAPALVLLSQNTQMPALEHLAYCHYAKALWQIKGVLSSAKLITLDGTLLTVLLLGLFEALVLQGRQAPTGWNAHVQGSMTLLRLRGPRQFESQLGRHLFLHASGNIMASYAHKCMTTPPELKTLRNHFARLVGPNNLTLRFEAVLDGFTCIRAVTEVGSSSERIQKALNLEKEMATILNDLGLHAPYEVVDAADLIVPVHAFNRHVYRYATQRLARQWNMLRILSLFLNEEIYDLIIQCDHEELLTKKWSRISRNSRLHSEQAILGILYSVPFALELSSSLAASARALIYPLSAVAVSKLASSPAMVFARNRLAFIGGQCRLAHAADSANMVLQSRNLEDWIHLSILS